MYPQTYLKTFWRLDLKPQVFVAMSFDSRYKQRFENIIKPAIESTPSNGQFLQAHRVDISQSGDSILTEISDGIAHSQLVLADVSSIGKDSVTGHSFRNGNVMYEVGMALACRSSCDVLIIRDDHDSFLFDVSTIPHAQIDFSDEKEAVGKLQGLLSNRISEQKYQLDARVQIAFRSLSTEELNVFRERNYCVNTLWGGRSKINLPTTYDVGICRLLDKGIIKLMGKFDTGESAYRYTELGFIVKEMALTQLDVYASTKVSQTESDQ